MYAIKYKNKYGHGWIEVSSLEEAAEFIGIRIVENPKTGGWIIKQRNDDIAYYTSEWTAEEAWRDFCRDLPKKHAAGVLAVYQNI
jgi:hypothetical protein